MASAFAVTKENGHALLQDSDGCYLLMTPIDDENFRVTNLETRVEKEARAAADEMHALP